MHSESCTTSQGGYAPFSLVFTKPSRGAFAITTTAPRASSNPRAATAPLMSPALVRLDSRLRAAGAARGGAGRASQRSADLRDADARVVADGSLHHAISAHRAARHQLDGPTVGHLAQVERPQHLAARGPERPEIRQRDAVQPPDQRRREAIAEHGVPWHGAGHQPATKPRPEDDICGPFADRLDQAAQLARPVAVIPVAENDGVPAVPGSQARQP